MIQVDETPVQEPQGSGIDPDINVHIPGAPHLLCIVDKWLLFLGTVSPDNQRAWVELRAINGHVIAEGGFTFPRVPADVELGDWMKGQMLEGCRQLFLKAVEKNKTAIATPSKDLVTAEKPKLVAVGGGQPS